MGHIFVSEEEEEEEEEGLVKPYILATDSTLLKSHGKVWHKSSMKKGIVPCSGIDTDARWGYSHTKGWIFGYKLHMWYQVLVLSLYLYQRMLQQPIFPIIMFIQI